MAMWWGIYALVLIGCICGHVYEILSERETERRNRYYWNQRDKALGITWKSKR